MTPALRHRSMARTLRAGVMLAVLVGLAACETPGPSAPTPEPRSGVPEPPPRRGSADTQRPPSGPARPAARPTRQYALGAAAGSLVTQARGQLARGEHAVAAATLERAMRIEPDHPLLWIELARVRQAQGNPAQAEAMGRTALSLASGDARVEAAAWRVIAESLAARGRNAEAREAERRAGAATAR